MNLRVAGWFGVATLMSLAGVARAEPADGKVGGVQGRKVASSSVTVRSSLRTQPATTVDRPTQPANDDGPLDPFRIGAFGGVGFPRPLSIEGFVKIEKIIGFGLEYSVLPTVSFSGVSAGMNALAGDVRVFPLENGFFIGLSGGHQRYDSFFSGSLPAAYAGANPQYSVDTWFINPKIGYLSTWKWGGTLGVDIGIQIPVSASVTNTIPTVASGTSEAQTAQNVAGLFGKSVLPTVDLLRIGFLL